MRVVVSFQDESQEFEIDEEKLVGAHNGPPGISDVDREVAISTALENPRDFPAISKMFVPGDRVAIVLDSQFSDAANVLGQLIALVHEGIGEEGAITVIAAPGSSTHLAERIPPGVDFVVHDPANREELAYLATTKQGQRIYLNRLLTDADTVLSIADIKFDSARGVRGPSTAIFPGLSDEEALSSKSVSSADDDNTTAMEVGWLLGTQFSVGLVVGVGGFSEILAGLSSAVEEQGAASLRRDWEFQVESPAELVVAGMGLPGKPTSIEELIEGISVASQLVQQGGKLVVLSRAQGELGPALRHLGRAREAQRNRSPLKGHESDPDYSLAMTLNRTLDWADIYLLSGLDSDLVEELGIVPLDKPRNATRLVATCRSCAFVSQAELTRIRVEESEEILDDE